MSGWLMTTRQNFHKVVDFRTGLPQGPEPMLYLGRFSVDLLFDPTLNILVVPKPSQHLFLICNIIHKNFKAGSGGKMLKASDQNWIIFTVRHHTFIHSIIHFVEWLNYICRTQSDRIWKNPDSRLRHCSFGSDIDIERQFPQNKI